MKRLLFWANVIAVFTDYHSEKSLEFIESRLLHKSNVPDKKFWFAKVSQAYFSSFLYQALILSLLLLSLFIHDTTSPKIYYNV